ASAALKAALSGEGARKAAALALGGDAVAEDALEMALLTGAAQQVLTLQNRLPKPLPALRDNDIEFLRVIFDDFCKTDPDVAPYVALIVMGRLARPWEALHLAAIVSRRMTDTVIANTDIGTVGELLFADLDVYTNKIQAARPADFEPSELVANLAAFTDLSTGMVKELAIRRAGKWGQRLAKDRAAVSAIMEGLVERAPRDIRGSLPA